MRKALESSSTKVLENMEKEKALYKKGQISKQTLVNRIESIFTSNVQRHASEVLGEVKNNFPDKDKKPHRHRTLSWKMSAARLKASNIILPSLLQHTKTR